MSTELIAFSFICYLLLQHLHYFIILSSRLNRWRLPRLMKFRTEIAISYEWIHYNVWWSHHVAYGWDAHFHKRGHLSTGNIIQAVPISTTLMTLFDFEERFICSLLFLKSINATSEIYKFSQYWNYKSSLIYRLDESWMPCWKLQFQSLQLEILPLCYMIQLRLAILQCYNFGNTVGLRGRPISKKWERSDSPTPIQHNEINNVKGISKKLQPPVNKCIVHSLPNRLAFSHL